MNTVQLAVCVLAALVAWSQLDSADARERRRGGGSSEARVEQAHGNLPPGAKTIDAGSKGLKGAPEGGAGSATKSGPTAPVTCNQQNASSPACYSATQQARPVAR
jgi:hypothetical protein